MRNFIPLTIIIVLLAFPSEILAKSVGGSSAINHGNVTEISLESSETEPAETLLSAISNQKNINEKLKRERTELEQQNTKDAGVQLRKPKEKLPADCPSLEDADHLTHIQLFQRMVHPCRFDRIQRPEPLDEKGNVMPVQVFVRTYIYFLENLQAYDLQFKMHANLQLRYVDPRLNFSKVTKNPSPILGEARIRSELWLPHIFLANEKESGILGMSEKDILTSISPDGTITIQTRIQAVLSCKMDFRKFPFDKQECTTVIEAWMYNETQLQLHWEKDSPIRFGPNQHLTEYVLNQFHTNETMVDATLHNYRHGDFAGNYTSLTFTTVLSRKIGFYIIDYYLPSIMIVAISWVTFWLQADQTAPRAMLGSTTMLTFVTLSTNQDNSLPKVSYIKVSEIWFIVCMIFIFLSLAEFAFVNIIWRRRKNVSLKKVNAKHILMKTLPTLPNVPLKRVSKVEENMGKPDGELRRTYSFMLHKEAQVAKRKGSISLNIVKNPHDLKPKEPEDAPKPSHNGLKTETIANPVIDEIRQNSVDISVTSSTRRHIHFPHNPLHLPKFHFTTMTPKEISNWIDRRSRSFFPITFLIFNIFYWTFVYL